MDTPWWDLVLAGRHLDAWAEVGPRLAGWSGSALLQGARLLDRLGDERGAARLSARAWRQHPTHPEVAADRLLRLDRTLGPVDSLEAMAAWSTRLERDDPGAVAMWEAAVATVHGGLRRHAEAESAIDRAKRLAPDDPWIDLIAARLLAGRDRMDEAIAIARAVHARRPFWRPAVTDLGRWLDATGQVEASLGLTVAAAAGSQCGSLAWRAAVACEHAGQPQEGLAWMAEAERRLIRMDRATRAAWHRQSSDLRLAAGDLAGAIADARRAGPGFHATVATAMAAAAPTARRVELAVPPERQDHNTCAPATLVSICRFHGIAADQRAVAAAICLDGTPDHRERTWAEEAGFRTVEFTVTWDAARRLIDHGLPFTLTTRHATGGHLQAVCGYDERRGTLLIRDPGTPYRSECLAEAMLRRQAAWGPRGMAMLPPGRHHLAEALALPDAAGWDRMHALRRALDRQDHGAAEDAFAALVAWDPDHDLRWRGQIQVARERGDAPARMAATRILASRHPRDPELLLMRLDDLRGGATAAERLALIAAARDEQGDPILDRCEAIERSGEATGDARAGVLLRRYLRRRPWDVTAWRTLARIARRAGRHDDAVAWSGIGAGLEPFRGDLAQLYADALVEAGRGAEAEAFLRDRAARLGERQAEPHATLAAHLAGAGRAHEAEAHLAGSAERLADPVEAAVVRLALARRLAVGDPERALAELERARPHASPAAWRRVAAVLAQARGDAAAAMAAWEAVTAAAPHDDDALATLTDLREEHQGPEAALRGVERALARAPWNSCLAALRLRQLRRLGDPPRLLAAARAYAERHGDAWGWREVGFAAVAAGDHAAAAEALARAEALDPGAVNTLQLAGDVAEARGDHDGAERARLAAVAADADATYAIDRLMDGAGDLERARRRLTLIRAELERQTTAGDGLWTWAHHATGWLPAEELDRTLDAALAARPDLWETWALRARAHRDRGQAEAAATLLAGAVERFPRIARLRVEHGRALADLGRGDEALAALAEGARLAPDWPFAVREWAERLMDLGRLDEAAAALDRLVARCPDDARGWGLRAAVALRRDDSAAAVPDLRRACARDARYDWAWSRLHDLDPDAADAEAEALAERRPRDREALRRLARQRRRRGNRPGARTVLERARALPGDPLPVLEDLARLLGQMEAWDEALAVCATEVAGTVPRSLRRLAARTTTERGDRDGGLAILDRLLDEMPEDIAARELRSEWRSAAGRHDEAVADATDLTVREPQRAVAWGYLGDALAMAGRNRAAAAAFRRGSDLDPGYDFGHAGWFDQALADGDLAGAAAALERLRRGEPAASTRRRAVRLAVAQGRPGDAADDLAALAADADAEEELVAACPERLPAEWLVVLHRAWETGGNRGVGTVLARDRVRGWSRRELAGWLMAGPRRTPAWNAAVGQLIDDTVNGVGPDPVPLLRRMMGGDLAADDRAWASVGWYLHERDRHREAVAWMADWQARPGCPAWALPYLIAPLIRIGRWRDGLAVAAAAPVEGGHADAIRTWRAWAAALDGDRERARELLPKVGALEPYQGMAEVHALVAALLDPDPEAPWRLAAARRGALTGARWEPFRPYVRATLGVLAERDGRWWRRWQARWLGW